MQYFQRKNQNRIKKKSSQQKLPVQRNHEYRLAVIVPAMNEEDTLGAVLEEINRLNPDELIVIVNGSKDQTASVASEKGATVIQFHYPLGNDVGRAIGAEAANADIYLFTDADIVIKAEQYVPFIVAIENGEDVSLNSIDWITHFDKADTISAGRYFLNHIQGREDLRAENLLTIPHAMSHHVLQEIGVSALVNPMLANSMALQKTKNITVPCTIDVLKMNKPRKNHVAQGNSQLSTAMQRMQGDTLEALHYIVHHGDLDLVDTQVVWDEQELEQCREAWWEDQPKKPVSFVVYIDDHYDASLVTTIAQLQRNETVEVIPVVAGECSVLCWQLEQMKQPYLRLRQIKKMGPAFELGQRLSRGDYCLFHHGFIPLTIYHVAQFVEQAIAHPSALIYNDQEKLFTSLEDMPVFFSGQRLVTMLNQTASVELASLLLPPFLLPKNKAKQIGTPETMQMDLLLENIPMVAGPAVNVQPFLDKFEDELMHDLLLGFRYLFSKTTVRGGFSDEGRRRELLPNLTVEKSGLKIDRWEPSLAYVYTGTSQHADT
ncbi:MULTISPECIES: glycosyltransferase family 2 protein [Bacillaceae]|uniref:4,4'-diaponeurosporenoate glycosyltransferase n=1 Tax=Alkalicoccobacillus plakortidis TaxID=444060 RepID=A0A9D5DPD7_9BACI|nr:MULTISPECIES: glycosyltransferase [Bacillaceae]KQL57676.1 hypothetical protein AN965_09340 [Alkalicoccobacillus plakortidis]